ncbi:MarR family winged helix-turn-helix transcriptional regulator [uncultured Sphingomonas sp.]|jgi:DNA-binding MarR family transcriptional regulator|uniref:MarR family winged helix-turn-helix transcriptional regulator n=1 Tax=uncultured Sphingomonas sp. TaxID=158754 RepID=UPI0035CAB748
MKRLVLENFIPYRLSLTSNLVSDTIARTYEALYGLSIPQWRLIAVTAEKSGVTQQAIGLQIRMDKVTVSRAAIALVERGLLRRIANAEDRRSHLLELTDAGRDLYAVVAPKALELERRIFSQFDRDEVATFTAMLQRIETIALSLED